VTDTAGGGPTRSEIRTVVASSILGTTVEWYDFFLYGIAAGLVFDKLFFPSADPVVGTLLAFATFAIGFVARPVGGLVFGHIGDRVGRKKTLVATMIIMGVATFLIGLVPSYATIGIGAPILLVLLRLAQGAAIGGEWGGAVLMAVEYAPRARRGYYGSLPQLGLGLGLLLGTGVFAGLNSVMSGDEFLKFGWRIAFMLSLILVAVGTFVRLKVMETPAFRVLDKAEQRSTLPALELVGNPRTLRNLLLCMGSRWAEGVAFNTWAVFVITYGTGSLRISRQTMLMSVMTAATVMVFFIPQYGRLSDRFDRRKLFALGVVISTGATYPALRLLGAPGTAVVVITVIVMLGVLYPMMYGPQPSLYAEQFPTRVRYSGISVVYQLSGIVASGLTPLLLTYLLRAAGGDTSMIMAYIAAVGVISAVSTMSISRRDDKDDQDEIVESAAISSDGDRRSRRQPHVGGGFPVPDPALHGRAGDGDRRPPTGAGQPPFGRVSA
jgi:MFS family permease